MFDRLRDAAQRVTTPKPVVVRIDVPAPIEQVWEEASDLESHVEWMADAERISFVGDARRGPGTQMKVLTKVGPLQTEDLIEVTAWEPPHRIAVRHVGAVTGIGEFLLEPIDAGSTRFMWREQLDMPWYFGGPFGGWGARPIFGWIWRRNLERFRDRFI